MSTYKNPYFTPNQLMKWSRVIRKIWDDICVKCGSKHCVAHHIISKNKRPDLALNLNNGVTLCVKCHVEYHKRTKTHPLED